MNNFLHTLQAFFHSQVFPPLVFWKVITTWDYWTNPAIINPPRYQLFFILCYIIVIYGLFLWQFILKRNPEKSEINQPIISNIWGIVLFITVLEIVYNFSYAEGIVYFSSRLMILAMAIIVICWIGALIYVLLRVLPKKYQSKLEKERFVKYLPKKKAKK